MATAPSLAPPDPASPGSVARVILQQCLSARLQVQPAKDDTPAEFVEIKRGLIIFICFLKGATVEIIDKMVKSTLNAKLSSSSNGKLASILDLLGTFS